jgi:hypothetical protein
MRFLKAIIDFFCEILFGCRHDKLTRPFTLDRETYKVCLDCGRQIYYSPETMRPLNVREVRRMRAMQSGEVKIVAAAAQLVPAAKQQKSAA